MAGQKSVQSNGVFRSSDANDSDIGVCFDFDGTLGDTETPAMEVAYWEIAPYLVPPLVSADEFIRLNAGKAFELMIEACDKERAQQGLGSIDQVRPAQQENMDEDTLAKVNAGRKKFGLESFEDTRERDLLMLQKNDTVIALSKTAKAIAGVADTLSELQRLQIPFNIATTSGSPRVLASRDASGLSKFFPDENVHSGETDFNPPKFKPDPAVYLKACKAHGLPSWRCISVEDSGSGVGSAANANMGLIIGFIGGSHILPEARENHAKMLMSGAKSNDGRGADLVLSQLTDMVPVLSAFKEKIESTHISESGNVADMKSLRAGLLDKVKGMKLAPPYWINEI